MLLFKVGFVEMRWADIVDVCLVSYLIYQLYKLLRGSIAIRIFMGMFSLYLVYLVVRAAQMELLTAILGQFMGVGMLAGIILFQQEIRKFLLIIGRNPFFSTHNPLVAFFKRGYNTTESAYISAVIQAAKSMSQSSVGALIAIERQNSLRPYIESGDQLDARLSKQLLLSIFFKGSPLHDGAVILGQGRIVAARCILPVSENPDLPAQDGLRHRAALGLSEITDALVILVSEETGRICLVVNGQMFYNLTIAELREKMVFFLAGSGK